MVKPNLRLAIIQKNPNYKIFKRNAEGVLNGNIFSIHKGRDLNDKDLSFFNTEMDVDAFEGHAVYFFGIGMVLWAWVFFEYAD